jgi:hypothetical protein
MARYFVGNGTNWSSTASWATSSGGASGASVPDSTQDVILDLNSPGNLTIDVASSCLSLTITSGFTHTVTHNAFTLTIGGTTAGAGNVALSFPSSGWTYTLANAATSAISFSSTVTSTTQTVDFGSKTTGNVSFNANATSGYQLVNNGFTCVAPATVTLTQGALDTNSKTCSWGLFASNNSNTRTLNLGSSAITLTGSTAWDMTTSTNMTLNFTTAALTFTGNNVSFLNGGAAPAVIFYPSVTFSGSGSATIAGSGGNFANLTRIGTATKTDSLVVQVARTVSVPGTLTLSGNSTTNRLLVSSGNAGISTCFCLASNPTLTNVDFLDIVMAGTTNYYPNPSFEDDTAGYTASNGTVDTSTAVTAQSGSQIAKVTSNGGGGISFYRNINPFWDTYLITAGQQYTASAYVQAASTTRALHIILNWYNSAGTNLGSASGSNANSVAGSWTRISATATAPTNAVGCLVQVVCSTTPANGEVHYIDAIQLTQSSGTVTYAECAFTGTSLGDCGGNTGIVFDAPATQTYASVAGGNWSTAANWTSRVPLPQDSVIVGSGTTGTLVADMPRLGAGLNFTGFAGTFNFSINTSIYGSLTFSSTMTVTGALTPILGGRSAGLTLTSAGKTFPAGLTLNGGYQGYYTIQDPLTLVGTLAVNSGTFDNTANNTVSVGAITGTGTSGLYRTVLLGSATYSLTSLSGTILNFQVTGNRNQTSCQNATFVVTTASASSRTLFPNGLTYGTLTYTVAGSTGALTFSQAVMGSWDTINFGDVSNARTLTLFAAGTLTIRTAFNVNGTSGKLMTINSSTPGTQTTLTKSSGIISCDFLSIQDSAAVGGTAWYAGANSTNVSNNSGWVFTAPPPTPVYTTSLIMGV